MSFGIFQFRRGTAAEWTAANPILLEGELGLEKDSKLFKIGDGTLAWNALPYGGLQGIQGIQGIQGVAGGQGIQGIQGIAGVAGTNGNNGLDGKNVELQLGATHLQWRLIGDTIWNNLIAITSITGPQGIQGNVGANGAQGIQGVQGPQGTPGTNGTNGVTRFAINVQALTSSPVDAQTVYFGMLPKAPITTANVSKIYVRNSCTIKAAEIYCYSGTAGTAEAWSLSVRKNNTTDTLIATVASATSERIFSNNALNIAMVAGDYFEIKAVNPTWATNPLTTIFGGYIIIEQ